MKPTFTYALLIAVTCASLARGQVTTSVPLGSTYTVWSSHNTASDGIQGWNATAIQSPSGRWLSEETHFGSGMPDGYTSLEVVLDELGTWQIWYGGGYDAPQSATTWWQPQGYLDVGGPPPNAPPTIAWILAPTSADHDQSYTVSARGHDDDGNLTQVNVWKDGQPFASAGGGNGTDGDSGNSTSDAGPQSITYTAQATDATSAVSAMISLTVTVAAPNPAFYTLTTSAATGGSVSAGGVFSAGTAVTLVATPDAQYDFAGWSGDAGGADNPLSVAVTRDLGIVASFSPKAYALTTNAQAGGAVTPGGSYPYGVTVSIAANPDAAHYFIGWSGDASGSAPSIAVLIDRAKFVQAQFSPKAAQTISFAAPGNQQVGTILPLTATSSSGLPVAFEVVNGPATLGQGQLTVTGPGAITVRALQSGDAFTLPAAPVTASFNATAPVVLRYQPVARMLLHDGRTATAANYVVSTP